MSAIKNMTMVLSENVNLRDALMRAEKEIKALTLSKHLLMFEKEMKTMDPSQKADIQASIKARILASTQEARTRSKLEKELSTSVDKLKEICAGYTCLSQNI
jgi:hypothetical protein